MGKGSQDIEQVAHDDNYGIALGVICGTLSYSSHDAFTNAFYVCSGVGTRGFFSIRKEDVDMLLTLQFQYF